MSFIVLKKCLSEPKQLLKLIVLILCICVATYQLSECFKKIIHPPMTTFYNFKLNESVTYPSLTICRNPGFKTENFGNYGLVGVDIPYYTNFFEKFDFEKHSLEDFFDNVTYTSDEVFTLLGYDGASDNFTVTENFFLYWGRCFTLTPMRASRTLSENGGYQVWFKHTATKRVVDASGVSTSGFHVFIHGPGEVPTDSKVQENSFLDYVYLETFEDIRINLRVQVFKQVPTSKRECVSDYGYSQTRCLDECVNSQLIQKVNCTVPWFPNTDYSPCTNLKAVKFFIKRPTDTNLKRLKESCNCPIPCHVSIYNTYIRSRRDTNSCDSVLWIYFASNLMTEMQEVVGYDFNMFVSDIGGSLGFLLGLSVIGFIKLTEQLILLIFFKEAKETDKDADKESETRTNVLDAPRINVFETKDDDLIKEKNMKNSNFILDQDYYYSKQNDKNEKNYTVSEKY